MFLYMYLNTRKVSASAQMREEMLSGKHSIDGIPLVKMTQQGQL